MSGLKRLLRWLSHSLLFLTIWFLWPRELDGFMLGREGRSAVPDYSMTNAHYVSVRSGKLEVETHAKEAAFNLTTHRMDAKSVVALIYGADERRTVVTADRAVFQMDERVLHLKENVTSLSPDGFLLRGPEATYSLKERLLTAAQPVEGETLEKEIRVWGDRCEAPIDQNKLNLYGNARALYQEPKHGPTKIRGDRAVLERNEKKVIFEKNVKVEQDTVTATSETADLFYSPEVKGVRYMSLNRDVRIQQGEGKYTRSQVAEFFAPTDTIVLTGFPAVYDGDAAVTGDKITVYRATGVVEVMATNAAGASIPGRGVGGKNNQPPPLSKEDEELIP